MKHLDLDLEKLEQRIAPWIITLPPIGGGPDCGCSGSGGTKPSKETCGS
jgi:hypothetical protein